MWNLDATPPTIIEARTLTAMPAAFRRALPTPWADANKGGEPVDLWFRATACFRREGSRWLITHMHNSVPFAMDGTDKALLDLRP